MTEKQINALNTILSALPEECQGSCREVAEYAISLGYMPVLKGTRKDYVDFTKNSHIGLTIDLYYITPEFTVLHWLNIYGCLYVVRSLGNFNC